VHLRRRRAPACGICPGEPHPHDMHLHRLLDTSVRGAAGRAASCPTGFHGPSREHARANRHAPGCC
jgi:hypothetical protein